MAENNFEKTEAPTPRRLREAREEGNVARSPDLTAALMLLAAVLLLYLLGAQVFEKLARAVEVSLAGEHTTNPAVPDDLEALFAFTMDLAVRGLGPLMLAIMAVGLVATVAQVGFLLTTRPLVPRFSRLSPIKGFQNLVNARAMMRLVMSLAKFGIIALVAGWTVVHDLPRLVHLGGLEVGPAFAGIAELVFELGLRLAVLLILLALIDFAFQKWQKLRDLRMSKQDVKQEMKDMEGDPLTKQRRTRIARQLAMQRVNHDVPKADVVVTNPTHFAIALRYDAQTMRAPKVLAKGADYLAIRIRQVASAHGIPIVERKPLAQALYRGVEIGQEIPPEHYAAVAEILAYVYRLAERKTA